MENTGKKKSGKVKIVLLVLIVLIAALGALVGFITDFMWFKELGYVSVFLKQLTTQIEMGVPVFIVVTLLTYIYLKLIKRGYYNKVDSTVIPDGRTLNLFSWLMSVICGGLVTYGVVTQLWYKWLNLVNSTDFGKSDPLYGNDISLYVFKLPFINQVIGMVMGLAIGFVILTVIYYAVLMAMRAPKIFEEEEEEPEVEFTQSYDEDGNFGPSGFENMGGAFGKMAGKFAKKASRPRQRKKLDRDNFRQILHIAQNQLIVVGVVFFLMLGAHFFIKQFDLLYTHRGAVYGAGFTDVNVTLWVLRILMVLSVVSAVTFAIGVTKKKAKTMVLVPIIMIALFAAGSGIEVVVQNYIVSPDELDKESKYLEYNIDYTQNAYDLTDVTVKSFSASKNLDGGDIANNPETISNIRINDYKPTQKLYNQTQSIRQYYDFNDVDVDRYMIDGDYTQTFLSAREINEENISNTFVNTHLKYTHGYGIALSRVDKVTSSGQADVLVGNIPPESDTPDIQVTNPAVYFGELTNNWILVNTDEKEFDYPDGDSNQYTKYAGKAGIKMNLINRVLFAVREKSLKLLVSSNITGDTKIVINRNIEKRVHRIMPYIGYDKDPYMVTVNGNLYWIIDAYTTSSSYPYAEPYSSKSTTNYIRNSVKVVIDAYNGTVNYYVVDPTDPIASTFQKIYPKLFKDISEMDEALVSHLRYPSTMFKIQAEVYDRYHMEDVSVFYQNEDLWSVANEIYGTKEKEMTPNYYIFKLPGEKNAEFVSMVPYTPKNKKNMTSILVARNDGEHYGELVLYQFPKSKVVYGPMQVEALIDQNTKISQDFSLWTSNGTSYSRGNLFVIPIEDSILYVEPVYLEAKNSSIPEVKKVIVVFGDQIAYEGTLAEALESMFGGTGLSSGDDSDADNSGDGGTLSQAQIIAKAQEAFDKAQKAQAEGDWASYGKYLNKLEKYLGMLE